MKSPVTLHEMISKGKMEFGEKDRNFYLVDGDDDCNTSPHMLMFEDSGTFSSSIVEDSDEEMDMGLDYPERTNQDNCRPGGHTTNPIAIPGAQSHVTRLTRVTDAQDIPFVHPRPPHGQSQPTTPNTTIPDAQSPDLVDTFATQSHAATFNDGLPDPGNLSLSPVLESAILDNLRRRTSGFFEEKRLRESGLLSSPQTRHVQWSAPNNCPTNPPPVFRDRSQSAPAVDAALVVQRQYVGEQLRGFGDQFYRAYAGSVPSKSEPSSSRRRLRRQVASCPGTKCGMWQTFVEKLL